MLRQIGNGYMKVGKLRNEGGEERFYFLTRQEPPWNVSPHDFNYIGRAK